LDKLYCSKGSKISVIGGLITYSSLHEWENDSEVYEECTNPETPVVMLPYELLALLLAYRDRFSLLEFAGMWEYSKNGVGTSRRKDNYWIYISKCICSLTGISREAYYQKLKVYHRDILLAVAEYRKLIQETIDQSANVIYQKLNEFSSMEALKKYAVQEIERRDNATALEYLKHINSFRYYRDQE